jgi:hypothetical protein
LLIDNAEHASLRSYKQTGDADMAYTYRCKDFPGKGSCPGSFTAQTEAELWKHIKVHALEAHQEDAEQWSVEVRERLQSLILSSNA